MADADGQGRSPGRPGGAARRWRRLILDAGWRELAGAGYAGLTFEAVAERAHTGKAALYRRWPKQGVAGAGVLSQRYFNAPATVPDTGSLRGDVLAVLRGANRLGDDAPALISVLLGAYFDENETPRHRSCGPICWAIGWTRCAAL
ncbi:TetR/AcrR family transcriptional regulator [Propionibacterium freudenreichii]|uniref:TetR/AcrR family transcriptional regulator n=1 Tax=Propionibacterium freudenreichii TaxID=1744 RepID=UPI00254D15A1|nr:TetR/AcrR family transcriptional regulator [Propionibacterium freudenreichii]